MCYHLSLYTVGSILPPLAQLGMVFMWLLHVTKTMLTSPIVLIPYSIFGLSVPNNMDSYNKETVNDGHGFDRIISVDLLISSRALTEDAEANGIHEMMEH